MSYRAIIQGGKLMVAKKDLVYRPLAEIIVDALEKHFTDFVSSREEELMKEEADDLVAALEKAFADAGLAHAARPAHTYVDHEKGDVVCQ